MTLDGENEINLNGHKRRTSKQVYKEKGKKKPLKIKWHYRTNKEEIKMGAKK